MSKHLESELIEHLPVDRRDVLRGVAASLLLSVSPVGLAAASSNVVAVRVWPAYAYTRVTIESDAPLTFKQFTLKDPHRLVVDLEGVELNNALQSLAGKVGGDDPYISALRAGLNKPGVVRLVLDLKSEVKPQVFTLNPVAEYKNRLVIDLFPATQNDDLLAFLNENRQLNSETAVLAAPNASQASKTAQNTTASKPEKTEPVDRSSLKVDRLITVVLDPGHGGEDPGAVGPSGTYEKTVVLQIAKRLRDLLHAEANFRVVMTRDADFFVPLGVRVRKARAVQADLFVSIHADAFVKPDANGSSVFALSEGGASSTAARWLAKTQNDADLIGGVKIKGGEDLRKTLLDLTTTATINDSLKVGKAMLGELGGINRLHKNSVEQASFAVLKAPDIPSVLVETAFISNPDEEKKLIDDDYQHKMALALLKGIKRYFAKNPPLARTRIADSSQ
ncbi:N-acetylmuramoyl-L-alanine amidase [Chitinibacter sp. S2-10]|uniref:N-acetylmuramoyl-L-alanine amidase n=1 Tax=Chitinibacter sp. S2-10 TaxID=3373597 RepID=UPI0039773A5B